MPTATPDALTEPLARAAAFPRLRFMGSKRRLLPALAEAFRDVGGATALDAFSGSGVVGYLLKAMGYAVTTNDFLSFPSVIAKATVENSTSRLSAADVRRIAGPAADDRDFVRSTFRGLYFTDADRAFLDSAWSHVASMRSAKRALAISALVLSAARKQPRGVFTVTDLRYDDGRRDLRLPLRDHFAEAADEYGRAVFDSGRPCRALHGDVFDVDPTGHDVVYLDPPYAPPKDDNCYVKRYHFLEGLSVYWKGLAILEETKSKKIAKRFTPFSYKHMVEDALRRLFERFAGSALVVSYSSNAVPDGATVERLLRRVKRRVRIREIDHRYHFGTHSRAERRTAREYLFVAR